MLQLKKGVQSNSDLQCCFIYSFLITALKTKTLFQFIVSEECCHYRRISSNLRVEQTLLSAASDAI